MRFNTVNGKYCCNASKVAVAQGFRKECFNTVNGKYCCNAKAQLEMEATIAVSIP